MYFVVGKNYVLKRLEVRFFQGQILNILFDFLFLYGSRDFEYFMNFRDGRFFDLFYFNVLNI